jgi:hypothetical protein
MTIVRYAGNKVTGVSGDTKPTNIPDGAVFYETNTLKDYLKVSSSWSQLVGGGTGYVLSGLYPNATTFSPLDGDNIIVNNSDILTSQIGIVVPKAGTMKASLFRWYAHGTAGSGENILIEVGVSASFTTVQTIGNTDAEKIFTNTSLSISVAVGDWINWLIICPTWATNPTVVTCDGSAYIE